MLQETVWTLSNIGRPLRHVSAVLLYVSVKFKISIIKVSVKKVSIIKS